MNRWLRHELVEFGAAACQRCGNRRLRHLHHIQLEEGEQIEVGCCCAAKLCTAQAEEIAAAEKAMTALARRQAESARIVDALRSSWKTTRKKRAVERVTAVHEEINIVVKWRWGSGWTVNLPGAPCDPSPRGYEFIMRWAETALSEKV